MSVIPYLWISESFNSTLVQLKEVERLLLRVFPIRFNSTLVQLKANSSLRTVLRQRSFNSTLVQLKVAA